MVLELPLKEMTTQDKLVVMEQLWDNLCRSPEDVLSPAWHGEILSVREGEVREGSIR